MRDWTSACEPIIFQTVVPVSFGCQPSSRSATPTSLELIPLERGLIALKAEGLYLCAELNGGVTLSATTCSPWECFLASKIGVPTTHDRRWKWKPPDRIDRLA